MCKSPIISVCFFLYLLWTRRAWNLLDIQTISRGCSISIFVTHSFIQSVTPLPSNLKNIINHKQINKGIETFRQCSPPPVCNVSHFTCHAFGEVLLGCPDKKKSWQQQFSKKKRTKFGAKNLSGHFFFLVSMLLAFCPKLLCYWKLFYNIQIKMEDETSEVSVGSKMRDVTLACKNGKSYS